MPISFRMLESTIANIAYRVNAAVEGICMLHLGRLEALLCRWAQGKSWEEWSPVARWQRPEDQGKGCVFFCIYWFGPLHSLLLCLAPNHNATSDLARLCSDTSWTGRSPLAEQGLTAAG